MVSPRISIIIRTMNRPEMLREALGSAIGQTMGELEILVCDDSRDDRSEKVVAGFSDPRVRYFRHQEPLGAAGNSRFGLERAAGQFVMWLDDDDALAPWWAERAHAELTDHPSAKLCFGEGTPRRELVPDSDRGTGSAFGTDILMEWMNADPIVYIGGGCVYRKNAIPPGQPEDRFEVAWDQALGVAVGREPASYVRVLAHSFWYREHLEQHSQLRSAALCRGGLQVYKELEGIERIPNRLYRDYYAGLARGLSRYHLSVGNRKAARQAAVQSWRIKAEPKSVALWFAGLLPAKWATGAIQTRDARKSKWSRPQPS